MPPSFITRSLSKDRNDISWQINDENHRIAQIQVWGRGDSQYQMAVEFKFCDDAARFKKYIEMDGAAENVVYPRYDDDNGLMVLLKPENIIDIEDIFFRLEKSFDIPRHAIGELSVSGNTKGR